MAGVQKVRLNNLNINLRNSVIVGIIIAKSSPRVIATKKKSGEMRGVTSLTLRDSPIDTINADVWGSEYFVMTLYERFLVGDVVEISSPKVCIKTGTNEQYRPQVSSPFYLSLNEGTSDICTYAGGDYNTYLPLLHIPTKPSAGYCGLAEVLKLTEENASADTYVDILVVVKSVKPAKVIKTRTGADMTVRSVEIMDNTTPASLQLDLFDLDTIQRAEDWKSLESVLFVSDARMSWKRAATLQINSRSVVTHQPHTADAEALRIYIRNQANTPNSELQAWSAFSGARPPVASVSQVRDRLVAGTPFCVTLIAMCTYIDLDDIGVRDESKSTIEEITVRFADHTGELAARLPVTVLEETFGMKLAELQALPSIDRLALSWRVRLENCAVKIAASPPRLLILSVHTAEPTHSIPLY